MSQGRTVARVVRIAFFLAVCGAIGGCQQWSTYPPIEMPITARMQRPAAEPVPNIIAISIQYAEDRLGVEKGLPINLPEGVPASVYEKVFAHLGGGRPMTQPGERAIHIKEVRTRGMDAQVDMLYPRSDGLYQFATLTLGHYVFEKWQVRSVRKWGVPAVPPVPNYVAPPPPKEKEEKPETPTGDTSENK